ncbi:MAG: adenylyltransferase/cytidyltransferase family protein [Candidatus Nanohaloarchaea archaeon]
MTEAVFIGRFQPLHTGHRNVIQDLKDGYGDPTVVIGSAAKSREEKNPLSLEEREEVIENCFPELETVGLEDEGESEEDNRNWVQKLIETTDPDVVVSGNELVQRLVREYTDAEVESPEKYEPDLYSGTEIRRRIRSGEEWRYLVPDCAQEALEDLVEAIRDSGQQYEFEPGWKRENAYHDTFEK